MGIGSFDTIALTEARELARQYRARVHQKPEHGGPIDPLEERQTAKAEQAVARAKGVKTFRDIAKDYLAIHSDSWKNSKHAAQWPSTLETYVYPIIGPVRARSSSAANTPSSAARCKHRITVCWLTPIARHGIGRRFCKVG